MSTLTPDQTFNVIMWGSLLIAITVWAGIAAYRYKVREEEKTSRFFRQFDNSRYDEDEEDTEEVYEDGMGLRPKPTTEKRTVCFPDVNGLGDVMPADKPQSPAEAHFREVTDDYRTRHIRRDPIIEPREEPRPSIEDVLGTPEHPRPRPIKDWPQA